jgi:hypothetical protein
MINFMNSLHLGWKEWLSIYVLPGLVALIYNLAKTYKDRPSEFARSLLKAMGRETSLKQHLENLLVYSIAVICMLFGWPGFLVWWIIDSRKEASNALERDKPHFFCAPEYLVNQISPEDAESTSFIHDPLGKTPKLPFGHLNTAWGYFLSDMLEQGDELWVFHIPKGSCTGMLGRACYGEVSGYAKVRNGQIFGEFITERD